MLSGLALRIGLELGIWGWGMLLLHVNNDPLSYSLVMCVCVACIKHLLIA